ncbi:phage holin family protein [Ancylobacter terrae]|uniref:phage holin family protein n=1 Tax=Ancylobacter sp. sgz301288 TaxID=3342077 RepID=UPI00385E2DAB
MFQFLLGIAGVEMRLAARRMASTALLFAIGGVLLVVALIGLLVAAFVALANAYDPIVAALIVAGIAFVGGTIVLAVAYARLKSPSRRATSLPLGALGQMPPASPIAGAMPVAKRAPFGAGTVIGVATIAAILGVALGRRL